MADALDLDKTGDTHLIRESSRGGGRRVEEGKCAPLVCGVYSKRGPKVRGLSEGRMGEGRPLKKGASMQVDGSDPGERASR